MSRAISPDAIVLAAKTTADGPSASRAAWCARAAGDGLLRAAACLIAPCHRCYREISGHGRRWRPFGALQTTTADRIRGIATRTPASDRLGRGVRDLPPKRSGDRRTDL